MFFKIVGKITSKELIARGAGVRSQNKLKKKYGGVTWRKLKGVATVQLHDGTQRKAEVHWYEAHGVGTRDIKIKRFLD